MSASAMKSLKQLGITDPSLKTLQRIQARSEGLLLLIAPPDAGKTSTLYALVKHCEQIGMDVLMIEHPVELVMPGVTQVSGHNSLSSHAQIIN